MLGGDIRAARGAARGASVELSRLRLTVLSCLDGGHTTSQGRVDSGVSGVARGNVGCRVTGLRGLNLLHHIKDGGNKC